MLNLPIVDAMRVKIIGRAVAPIMPSLVTMSHQEAPPERSTSAADDLEYRSSVEVVYRETAPAGAAELVRETAVRALAHTIYKSVRCEIIEAILELRAAGVPPTELGIRRLEAMLDPLEGRPAREPTPFVGPQLVWEADR